MKKWFISSLVLIVVIVLGSGIYYMVPKTVNELLKGVEYQLGSSNHQIYPVTINRKGKVYHSFLGERSFIGAIDIIGVSYPNPDKEQQVEIKFLKNGMGYMNYGYFKNGHGFTHVYGAVFANKDFSKVTIEDGLAVMDGWLQDLPIVEIKR